MKTAPQELVTIARFPTLGEAQVARGLLEASGVRALVLDQDVLRFDPFRPGESIPVRLQVLASQRARAAEILAGPVA